jgi:LysM repeat protein
MGTFPVAGTMTDTITSNSLPTFTPGQTLVPGFTSEPNHYTVQSGDTLSGIAEEFGISVEALREANGINGDLIYAGDVLIIPAPSASPTPSGERYLVQARDTVDSIAAAFGISADELRTANFMYGDALLTGQSLNIPRRTPAPLAPYRFSTFQGDVAAAFPLSVRGDRFALHYTPDTFPAQDPQAVFRLVEKDLSHIEKLFRIHINTYFDVYVMGTVFEPPNAQLRGISFVSPWRSFFLDDGSGNATDLQYINTHEMTHLIAWNTLGKPYSDMISEGAAVYSGMTAIEGSDYIPLNTFCAVYKNAGNLPAISSPLSFLGHTYDLPNYYAAGCFVGYLINTYGAKSFGDLYSNGNFPGVYGKSQGVLEQEWKASLEQSQLPPDLDGSRLISSVQTIAAQYHFFMPSFSGTSTKLQAYRELDLARLALMCGKFNEMDGHLEVFHRILNTP